MYFYWLLQNFEKGGVEGLRLGIEEVGKRKFTALNFLMSDGRNIYAYWAQAATAKVPYQDYYQLYYSMRGNKSESGQAVVVCSERLDDGEWARIPQGALMTISENLEMEVVPLH